MIDIVDIMVNIIMTVIAVLFGTLIVVFFGGVLLYCIIELIKGFISFII